MKLRLPFGEHPSVRLHLDGDDAPTPQDEQVREPWDAARADRGAVLDDAAGDGPECPRDGVMVRVPAGEAATVHGRSPTRARAYWMPRYAFSESVIFRSPLRNRPGRAPPRRGGQPGEGIFPPNLPARSTLTAFAVRHRARDRDGRKSKNLSPSGVNRKLFPRRCHGQLCKVCIVENTQVHCKRA